MKNLLDNPREAAGPSQGLSSSSPFNLSNKTAEIIRGLMGEPPNPGGIGIPFQGGSGPTPTPAPHLPLAPGGTPTGAFPGWTSASGPEFGGAGSAGTAAQVAKYARMAGRGYSAARGLGIGGGGADGAVGRLGPGKAEQRLPSIYKDAGPAKAGLPALTKTLSDPYNLPEGRLTGMLENTELAYNRAGSAARQSIYGTGGSNSGVQRRVMGSMDVARASEQAKNLREFEQWRTMLGDERLSRLLMPYLQLYNQAYGYASTPGQTSGSGWDDFFALLQGAPQWVDMFSNP